MKKLFVVMLYDYEDPDWSDVEFTGTSKDECYDWIDRNFQDFLDYEWDEAEDGVFSSRRDDKWLKSELHLEIVELNNFSETLQKLLSEAN